MIRSRLFLVLSAAFAAGQLAQAFSSRNESIEWWTSVSDAVYIAEITSAKEIPSQDDVWASQELRSKVTAVLKGERQDALEFKQGYSRDEKVSGAKGAADHKLRPKERVLLFWAKATAHENAGVIFWCNVTQPGPRWSKHAAYGNDCKRLTDGDEVVKLVKERVAKEDPRHPVKRRGLIIDFKDNEEGVAYYTFVRTADPEYKKTLIDRLRNRDGDDDPRVSAIYNLVSYPGQETIDLLKPFLKDSTAREHEERGRKIRLYPLRQMAYVALDLLGDKPAKPDGFRDDYVGGGSLAGIMLLNYGFEDEAMFPWGDWKRFGQELSKPAPLRDKWERKVVIAEQFGEKVLHFDTPERVKTAVAAMNDLGAEGWELSAVGSALAENLLSGQIMGTFPFTFCYRRPRDKDRHEKWEYTAVDMGRLLRGRPIESDLARLIESKLAEYAKEQWDLAAILAENPGKDGWPLQYYLLKRASQRKD
jgi:hypothetical protein